MMQLQSIQLNAPIELSNTSLPDKSIVNDQYCAADLNREYGSIYIDNHCKVATMDNYAMYVEKYNQHVVKYNAMVAQYNEEVEKNVLKGISVELNSSLMIFCAQTWNRPNKVSKSEWILSAYSHEKALKHRPVNVYNYNALVRKFNEENGKVLPLVTATKFLGDTYKDTFQTLLYWYSGKNAARSLNWNTAGTYGIKLPYMEFNAYNLSKSKRKNGALNSSACYRTKRNHRIKLEEAGIIVKGSFHGTNEARRFYFNPQILVVWDMNQHKITGSENQSLNSQNRKTLPNKCESTKPLNNIKNKGINDSLSLSALNSLNLNTPMQAAKKVDRPAAPVENLPPNERKSRARLKTIEGYNTVEYRKNFAKKLSSGKYNYHKPLNMTDLYDEASNGTLSRKETADYLSQEFIKLSSRLWSDKNVFIPVWIDAIKLVNNTFFRHQGVYVNKLTMVEQYRRHVQRLVLIINYLKDHPEYKLLFPSLFYQPHRTKKGSGGYAYSEILLRNKEQERDSTEKLLEKSRIAERRKEFRRSRNTKMRTITRKFLRNKITYNDLYNEVVKNLAEYKHEIPKWIDDERLAMEKIKIK